MTHRPDNDIPTWAGRVDLRWHAALALGLVLGFVLASLIGAIL